MNLGDPHHQALLKIPTGQPNGAKLEVACRFDGIDGKVLRLAGPERVGISTLVSVEYSDAMFLGEVISCRTGTPGNWEMDIKVDQILTGLQSLMTLRSQLLGEAASVGSAGFTLGVKPAGGR